MIKYVEIEGYKGLGECGFTGSHLYQWMSTTGDEHGNRATILVRAYDVDEPTLFKGQILMQTKQYNAEEVTAEELAPLEELLGKVKVFTDFQEFLSGHGFVKDFAEFKQADLAHKGV